MASYIEQLYWKYVGSEPFTAATPAGACAALAALLARTVYPGGAVRTPDSGKAWTGTLGSGSAYVQAVAPAGGRGGVVVWGWDAGTPGEPLIGSDTHVANALMMQSGKHGGALTGNWYAANPFGVGVHSTGCVRASTALSTVGAVYLWESEDGISIAVKTAANTIHSTGAGWIVDPSSEQAADIDATEGDGAKWGLWTSGSTAIPLAAWSGNGTGFGHFHHAAPNGSPHFYYVPAGGGVSSAIRSFVALQVFGASTNRQPSGRICLDGTVVLQDFTSGSRVGVLRGVCVGPLGRTGREASFGATRKATACSGSDTLDTYEALWFKEVD